MAAVVRPSSVDNDSTTMPSASGLRVRSGELAASSSRL